MSITRYGTEGGVGTGGQKTAVCPRCRGRWLAIRIRTNPYDRW